MGPLTKLTFNPHKFQLPEHSHIVAAEKDSSNDNERKISKPSNASKLKYLIQSRIVVLFHQNQVQSAKNN